MKLNVYVRSLLEVPPINHTPFFLPGAGGPRTMTIEKLKEGKKVSVSYHPLTIYRDLIACR